MDEGTLFNIELDVWLERSDSTITVCISVGVWEMIQQYLCLLSLAEGRILIVQDRRRVAFCAFVQLGTRRIQSLPTLLFP